MTDPGGCLLPLRPRISEFALVGLATAWSFSLVLGGLWGVFWGWSHWRGLGGGLGGGLVAAGVAAVAAGHVVFLSCVAERIFPRASPTVVLWMEMISCATFFVASTVCLFALFG